ncbi:MAG: type I restriction endonuclease [Desulfuromonadaceae bacterium]|nr:type I restriction endonuclease [Desulfuromonadaceae bacterium]
MTDRHREITFEQELVSHLTGNGWLEGDQKKYDRELAIYPEDLIGWLQDTQPKELEKLSAFHGKDTERKICERAVALMDKDGSLALLRHGFKDHNAKFQLCQFKPSHGLNPEIMERYNNVRCRVVRQVRYSRHNENSIDLVLFVNGIPVATLELKTDFTQSVSDAIKQYRYDRNPKDSKSKHIEPLLAFKRRALVHFAVSTDEVYMTTELKGKETNFLPFNIGNNGGQGNPANPDGYRTSYLWERVLNRDHWLDIIGRFVHLEKKQKIGLDGSKSTVESMIFPRYHQWEVVTELESASQKEGPGQTYLAMHSAGSGKSNSIAWLSHRLASLHDKNDKKTFDSVIVITDRTVLDSQLQETIYQFEHKEGVVCRIKKEGVKSSQLVQALVDRKPIIIVTIQTFPFVLEEIQQLTSLKDRTFAVIIDEAHSSQSGAASRRLRQVLTAEQIEEDEEVSAEDVMLAEMAGRLLPKNVSFFAFTATPKAKTIELFGRPGVSGIPEPFHVYSMQQAIEEGFILDVLKNFTPYSLAYRLAVGDQEYDEEVDKGKALKQLSKWVRLHPYNISQKVIVIVEHFRSKIAHKLNGHAKAMVVTSSRKEAVRYKLAIDKYIHECGYKGLQTIVAFSGDVTDTESGPNQFNESNMNKALKGRDIREAFGSDEFQVLIVANKFQTGFDQPLLCAMYVDKKLSGVAAVQTFSRLNRIFPGKTETFILDFVNDPEEILKAFEPYYRTAELSGVTDPNIVHTLQAKIDQAHIYTESEVESFAHSYFDPKGTQKEMQAHIAPAVDRFRIQMQQAKDTDDNGRVDELRIFRKDLSSFVKVYDFLSQLIDYGDTDLEKRSVFCRHLLPWLTEAIEPDPIDLSQVKMTHYRLNSLNERQLQLGEAAEEDTQLKPLTDVGSGQSHDPEAEFLSAIISQLNTVFEGDLSDADLVGYATHISGKMLENEGLSYQASSNSKEQFALGDFNKVLMDTIISGLDNYQSMASQVLGNERVKKGFEGIMLEMVYEGFKSGRFQAAEH